MRCIFVLLIAFSISCKSDKKYHDAEAQKIAKSPTNLLAGIASFQNKLNEEFKNPETSPLPDRYRKNFETLAFFVADTNLIVQARLARTPNALPFDMPTTTERMSREVVYAVAHFELNGKPQQLEIYQNKDLIQEDGFEDYLFLPFTDLTNGASSYEGGRFIDLKIPENETILIDFNRAYNPYCAYNKKYSCPIVPSVNALDFRVEAGVKAFIID